MEALQGKKSNPYPIEYRALDLESDYYKTHFGPCQTVSFLFSIKSVLMYFWTGAKVAKVS